MQLLDIAPSSANFLMAPQPDSFPALEPQEDETVLPGDFPFVEECRTRIAEDARKFGWRFGGSVLTESAAWGRVWRTDFETANGPWLGHVNRVICWRSPDGDGISVAVAFGQRLEQINPQSA